MKNKKLTNTVMALSALALIGGGLIAVQAAEDISFERHALRGSGEGRGFANLSEEEKAEREATRESHRAEMSADREAVEAAIAAQDFNAWKEAIGENNPFADKITVDNFSKFIEAHNLMNQAKAIFAEIGVEYGPGMGKAAGHGRGMGQGFGNFAK